MRALVAAVICLMVFATPVVAGDESADQNAEIVFWQSISDGDDPEDFVAYLEQYPDGAFGALARNRLKRMGVVVVTPERTDTGADSSGYSEAVRNRLDVLKAIHDKGLITDEEYAQKRRDIERGSGHPASLKERLTTLKTLFDEGELTQSEYDTQRRAILKDSKTVTTETFESLDGVYKAVTPCGDTIQMEVDGRKIEGWSIFDSATGDSDLERFKGKSSANGFFDINIIRYQSQNKLRGTLSRATLEECPGSFAFTKVE